MTREEQLKAIGLKAGARVVGIAAVEAFREKVPEGYRPEDILPGARSVVVAGGDGPTAGAWRSPDNRVMEITGYDLRENVAIHAMCDFIEGTLAHHAIQAPSLPVHGHEPPMSMMHAAELAGLGTRSLAAHIILNPEYGLLYYAALITTLPLEPDQPLAEPACPHPGCVAMYKRIGTTPCLRVCPACLSWNGAGRTHPAVDVRPREVPLAGADVRHRLVPEGAVADRERGRPGAPAHDALQRLLHEEHPVARLLPRLDRPVLRVHARLPGRTQVQKAPIARGGPPNAGATAKLKSVALKGGATVCGIADAAAFDAHAPEKHRPGDLLPGARTVIVVGGSQPREGDWAATSPWVMQTMGTTERIQGVGRRLAQYIESEFGYYALYVPPGTASGDTPFLSLMLAAELAGLGSKSLAGPVLNREHGFMYWSAVITTAPFDADGVETSPACPAPACREMWDREGTTPCLATCPVSNGGCLSGKLENGRAVRTFYDAARCNTRVHTHWVGGFQKVLEETLNEPDRDRRKMLLYGDFFTRSLWAITYSSTNIAQCFECMRVCPAAHGLREMK